MVKKEPSQPNSPEQRLLTDEQIQPLFYNIEAILGFNKVLYEDLVREAERSGGSVGNCFIKFVRLNNSSSSLCLYECLSLSISFRGYPFFFLSVN